MAVHAPALRRHQKRLAIVLILTLAAATLTLHTNTILTTLPDNSTLNKLKSVVVGASNHVFGDNNHDSLTPPPSPKPSLYIPPLPPANYSLADLVTPITAYTPSKKYMTYLPFAGLNNQFFSLQNAAVIAKRLNRVLVLPPIMSHYGHDRVTEHQPWSEYMDLDYFSQSLGIEVLEWTTIRPMNAATLNMVQSGHRRQLPDPWRSMTEKMDCQVINGFWTQKNSQGADFAYQMLLDIRPIPVPGYRLKMDPISGRPMIPETDEVIQVQDIVDANMDSDESMMCLSYTFKVEFGENVNRWQSGFDGAGQYLKFWPRFEVFVEEFVAYRLRFRLKGGDDLDGNGNDNDNDNANHNRWTTTDKNQQEEARGQLGEEQEGEDVQRDEVEEEEEQDNQSEEEEAALALTPVPPRLTDFHSDPRTIRGQSILDHYPAPANYIAIHLRRGDIGEKCAPRDPSECVVPLSIYQQHVDAIYNALPPGVSRPPVVLLSDTKDEKEKQEIVKRGWLRIDHVKDPVLTKAKEMFGYLSPAMIDSLILSSRSAKWVLGSQKSSMSWVASLRLNGWHGKRMIYPTRDDNEASLALAGKPLSTEELKSNVQSKKQRLVWSRRGPRRL